MFKDRSTIKSINCTLERKLTLHKDNIHIITRYTPITTSTVKIDQVSALNKVLHLFTPIYLLCHNLIIIHK